MITATTWVPRGAPAAFPVRSNFDEAEFRRISALAKLQIDDAKDDLDQAQRGGSRRASDEAEAVNANQFVPLSLGIDSSKSGLHTNIFVMIQSGQLSDGSGRRMTTIFGNITWTNMMTTRPRMKMTRAYRWACSETSSR